MRKIVLCLSLCLVFLLSGCGGSSKVNPPFSYNERSNYSVDDAISLFEDSGFTNISTESTGTIFDDKIGKVNSVSIDGNMLFANYNNYSPDVPVIITYYVAIEREEAESSPDQRYADNIGYSLEQYTSMKEALISCGVSEDLVRTAARIGSHEACLVVGNFYFTINFDNAGECTTICNADAVFYDNGEVVQLISEYIK